MEVMMWGDNGKVDENTPSDREERKPKKPTKEMEYYYY